MQQNDRPGFLILCPSSRSTERYMSELVKKMVLLIQFYMLFQRVQSVTKEKQQNVLHGGFTKSRRKHLLCSHLRKD